MPARILIVDDEANLRETLAEILGSRGYAILQADDGSTAIDLLQSQTPELIFSDWKMPHVSGEELLQFLRRQPHLATVPTIVMTAFVSSHSAIEAVRLGAYDFVTKPFDLDAIVSAAERALDHAALNQEVHRSHTNQYIDQAAGSGRLIGISGPMLDVFILIGKVAATDSTVLICGESGTGKELVAQAIHQYSQRRDKPFIVVNCAALPENLLETELFGHERGAFTGAIGRKIGRFEMAQGGTVFLDEIGELSPNLQSKLLRVLQGRTLERVGGTETIHCDFRVLAATNRDLDACVREGVFRGRFVLSVKRSAHRHSPAARTAFRYRFVGKPLSALLQREKQLASGRFFGCGHAYAAGLFLPGQRAGIGEHHGTRGANGPGTSVDAGAFCGHHRWPRASFRGPIRRCRSSLPSVSQSRWRTGATFD